MGRLELKGGVAVVTGAASGIGAGLAASLARRGMHLALADRNAAGLETVAHAARAAGVRASTHVLDVTDRAALAALPQAVLAEHQRVTVLVNNAGVALAGSFDQIAHTDFDWLMAINFEAPVRLTRAFLPVLARERAAQVVNISSIFGIVAPPGQTAYAASKFALRGFSESLRHELEMARSGIGVTIVHPGGVRTAIAEQARIADAITEKQREEYRQLWERVLKMAPEEAGDIIAEGIARRERRLFVGKDAKQAAFLQWLFPVSYWKYMARDLMRKKAT